jgi:hypothetical protein
MKETYLDFADNARPVADPRQPAATPKGQAFRLEDCRKTRAGRRPQAVPGPAQKRAARDGPITDMERQRTPVFSGSGVRRKNQRPTSGHINRTTCNCSKTSAAES